MVTLILQTHEGQKIELNFQPEDTFADLQNQYSYNDGLSDSLKQLITNGDIVPEHTKIFDYVTGGAHQWFGPDHDENADDDDALSTAEETRTKGFCEQGDLNSVPTTPSKTFLPLPMDHERLSMCPTDSGISEIYNEILESDVDNCQKYFTSDGRFGDETSSSHLPFCTGEQSAVSLLKPKNERTWTNVKNETILNREEESNDRRNADFRDEDAALELFDGAENFEHPGILCRLCCEPTANPINLYDAEEDTGNSNLADTINFCLPITVTVTDPLPKQICVECRTKLNTCHELALSCLRTEDKLGRLLREKKFCVDGNNAKQKCPLCLEGDVRTVKSGIYRRNDLKTELLCSENANERASVVSTEKIDSTKDFNDVSACRTYLSLLSDSVSESNGISVKIENSDVNLSSSLKNEEFSGDDCSSRVNGSSIDECTSRNEKLTENRDHRCDSSPRETSNYEITEEIESHDSRSDVRDGKFACGSCRFECDELEEAAEHANSCKPETLEIRCQSCKNNFATTNELNDHRCYQISFDLRELDEKIDERSNNPTKRNKQSVRYDCYFCRKPFSRKDSLETHISAFHTEKVGNPTTFDCYKCKICNETFAREADAEFHINLRHVAPFADSSISDFSTDREFAPEAFSPSRLYVCEYCQRFFAIPSSLHDHRETEHNENPEFSCSSCERSFDSHRKLANHRNDNCRRKKFDIAGAKKFYVCKYCDKTFLHYSSLAGHVVQHRDIDRYLCRPCNANFATYREIAVHRDVAHPYQSTVHERSKRFYKCQYCQKQFGYEVALVKHVRIHTGERPYKCSVCGKGFAQSSGLNTHAKIHSDVRPYACPECPRTFKIKGDCDNHVKRHSGNRPYKCEFCAKAFMTQHVYSQHRKIHTNDRPYKCDVCGEAFLRSHVLTVHRRIHTGEKPHVCDVCPKTYRQRGDLVKHRKVQHGIGSVNAAKHNFSNNFLNNSYNSFVKPANSSLLLPL